MDSFNQEACEYDYSNPVTENFILFGQNNGFDKVNSCLNVCYQKYGGWPQRLFNRDENNACINQCYNNNHPFLNL
jgi:hypothetical protein